MIEEAQKFSTDAARGSQDGERTSHLSKDVQDSENEGVVELTTLVSKLRDAEPE